MTENEVNKNNCQTGQIVKPLMVRMSNCQTIKADRDADSQNKTSRNQTRTDGAERQKARRKREGQAGRRSKSRKSQT